MAIDFKFTEKWYFDFILLYLVINEKNWGVID